MLVDPTEVGPRGSPQAIQSASGEDGLRAASVRRARAPLDQAITNQAIDQSRDATLAEQDLLGEEAHPDPSVRGLGDVQQRFVFSERDVVLGAELFIHSAGNTGVGDQEGAPRREILVVGQPLLPDGIGDGHDGMLPPWSISIGYVVDVATIVRADVTVRNVTRSLDFEVAFPGFYTGMDGARRAGLSARAEINRRDWGLNWNVALEAGGWPVSDKITLEVELAIQEAIVLAA